MERGARTDCARRNTCTRGSHTYAWSVDEMMGCGMESGGAAPDHVPCTKFGLVHTPSCGFYLSTRIPPASYNALPPTSHTRRCCQRPPWPWRSASWSPYTTVSGTLDFPRMRTAQCNCHGFLAQQGRIANARALKLVRACPPVQGLSKGLPRALDSNFLDTRWWTSSPAECPTPPLLVGVLFSTGGLPRMHTMHIETLTRGT